MAQQKKKDNRQDPKLDKFLLSHHLMDIEEENSKSIKSHTSVTLMTAAAILIFIIMRLPRDVLRSTLKFPFLDEAILSYTTKGKVSTTILMIAESLIVIY